MYNFYIIMVYILSVPKNFAVKCFIHKVIFSSFYLFLFSVYVDLFIYVHRCMYVHMEVKINPFFGDRVSHWPRTH